jgi:uncharacterized protein (DUF433 family)
MTIKWVKSDPLVMGGEPFCYGSRLTVRQLLEERRNGYAVPDLLRDHPELRVVGIAHAYRFAGDHRERYAEFFDRAGNLVGPGLSESEAEMLPEEMRIPGVVVGNARAAARR